ncbi:alpha-tocopherol transfer protein-like [Glandiceps talaboti]
MSDSGTRRRYVSTLSAKTAEKAKQELNEDPETRDQKIDELRGKFRKEKPEVKLPPDDAFLVRFLRNKKFDVDRAFKMLLHYYDVRRKYKEIFVKYQPSFYKHIYDLEMVTICPGHDDEGRTVLLFRIERWDPDRYSLDSILTAVMMLYDKLLEDEEVQVHGIVFVGDYEHLTMKMMTKFGPLEAKKQMDLIMNVLPLRMKAFHYVRQSEIFDTLMAIFKPLMNEKMLSRIHLHGKDFGTLHKYVPSSMLPTDFGGQLTDNNSAKEFFDELVKEDVKFAEYNQYGFPKAGAILGAQSQGVDPVGGLAGSFKKLET